MDRKLIYGSLLALALFLFVAAGPFGTHVGQVTQPTPPPQPGTIYQTCTTNLGGLGAIAPCPAGMNASLGTLAVGSAVVSTVVVKMTQSATPPAGQSKLQVSLLNADVAVTMANACVCSGQGTANAWSCASTPKRMTCGGINSCAMGTGTGAPVTLDLTTQTWATPMLFAFDFSAVNFQRPYLAPPVNSPAASINYYPGSATVGPSSFNSYTKTGVSEACTASRSTGYTVNFSTGKNSVGPVSKIVVQ